MEMECSRRGTRRPGSMIHFIKETCSETDMPCVVAIKRPIAASLRRWLAYPGRVN